MAGLRNTAKPEKKCLDAALRLLARRDHSRKELSRKLKKKGFPGVHIQGAIERCLHYDYLDDERFAHQHARQLQRRGYGARRIRQSLRTKGIDEEITEIAVQSNCTDRLQSEQCRKLLQKKLGQDFTVHPAKKLKPKLYRYLLGRGFAPSIVTTVLGDVLEKNYG